MSADILTGAGVGPDLLDSLDRTDLLWFARHADSAERTRRTMPAEADHIERALSVRPRRVTVRRLAAGVLARDYGPAGVVLAFVSSSVLGVTA